MRFNPLTRNLYTDDGRLIKKLQCTYGRRWEELLQTGQTMVRYCDICDRDITNTKNMADEDVMRLVSHDPAICLRVSIDQSNVRVVSDDDWS